MRIAVVVRYVRQILAWYPQVVREVVIADCEHDSAGLPHASDRLCWRARRRDDRRDGKGAVFALDGDHLFVKRDLKPVGVYHAPVVTQRFETSRLVVRGD